MHYSGSSVAISGNKAIIGASGSDEYTGSAYVYEFPDALIGSEPGRETGRTGRLQNGQTNNVLILDGSLSLAEADSGELSSGSGGCAISADGSRNVASGTSDTGTGFNGFKVESVLKLLMQQSGLLRLRVKYSVSSISRGEN